MDKSLQKIICCPTCQGDLRQKENRFICKLCRKEYLIKNDIPVLLTERI